MASDRSDESPALRRRSEHYPAAWGGRVPSQIRMIVEVWPDLLASWSDEEDIGCAEADAAYPCWVNSHGAVAAILPSGARLGVKPDEYEIAGWHESEVPDGHS